MAGVFSQILCIGVARFACTPMLQQQTWMSEADGGWLAALNYAGYMLGALVAASTHSIRLKDTLYRLGLGLGLGLAVLSTAGMALTESFWAWTALRRVDQAAQRLDAEGKVPTGQ